MALTLTVGTNTYISLADAETYMESRYEPSGLWDAATDAVKNKLLAHATKIIDRQPWRGYKSDGDQALQFPRNGEATTDDSYEKVEAACVEQALWLLIEEPDTRGHLQAQGVRSFSMGGIGESFAAGGVHPLCPEARELLGQWLVLCGAIR